MARPSKYTKKLGDQICKGIISGRGMRQVCADLDIQPSAVYRWLTVHKEFQEQYARAREIQAELLADEIVSRADSAHDVDSAAAAKVQVEARKWVASKLLPKKYGEKLELEHGVSDSLAERLAEAQRRLAASE